MTPPRGRSKFEQLAQKYAGNHSFYFIYPDAFAFDNCSEKPFDYKRFLARELSKSDTPGRQLYVHFPFCPSRCNYCVCPTVISRSAQRADAFLATLEVHAQHLAQFSAAEHLDFKFRELHIGGGSPSNLPLKDFERLVRAISPIVDISTLVDFALEVDPRNMAVKTPESYRQFGVSRLSIGVQDFDPYVQKLANRVQSIANTKRFFTDAVRDRFESINVDLIAGLPGQTVDSTHETLKTLLALSPDRISLTPFILDDSNTGYFEHSTPPHSRLPFSEFPYGQQHAITIYRQFEAALLEAGYLYTGYAHFAKPGDKLAQAVREKRTARTSIGFSANGILDTLGLGPASTSCLGSTLMQNICDPNDYETAIAQGEFPLRAFKHLDRNDLMRRHVIHDLLSYFSLDLAEFEQNSGRPFFEAFDNEIEQLEQLEKDGLIEVDDASLTITPFGIPYTRTICSLFDSYFQGESIRPSTHHKVSAFEPEPAETAVNAAGAYQPGELQPESLPDSTNDVLALYPPGDFPDKLSIEIFRSPAPTQGNPFVGMSLKRYSRLLDQFPRGRTVIQLVGCNAARFNPDFFKILAYTKQRGDSVAIYDSFSEIDGETLERLMDACPDQITVSFPGGSQKTSQSLRPDFDFSKAINAMKRMVEIRKTTGKNKPAIRVDYHLTQTNHHEIASLLDRVSKLTSGEPVGIRFNNLAYPRSQATLSFGDLSQSTREHIIAQAIRLDFDVNPEMLNGQMSAEQERNWLAPFVDLDGNVFPFSRFSPSNRRPIQLDSPMGNVFERHFLDIWQAKTYEAARKAK